MYKAVRRTESGGVIHAFGETSPLAVFAFIDEFELLPAVVYSPEGFAVVRVIVGEMPEGAEDRYEPAAALPPGVVDPRD